MHNQLKCSPLNFISDSHFDSQNIDIDRKLQNSQLPALSFLGQNYMRKNRRTNNENKPYQCNFEGCGKHFTRKFNMKHHFLTVHKNDKPFSSVLEDSEQTVGSKTTMEHDLLTHKQKEFGSRRKITSKQNQDRPNCEKLYKCSVCSFSCISRVQWKVHMRSHKREKPFKCDFEGCGKSFNWKCSLKSHSLLHAKRSFSCTHDNCNQTFIEEDLLKHHLLTQHENKESSSQQNSALVTQVASEDDGRHTRRKLHKCPFCGFSFVLATSLEEHVRIHTGEEPFQCDFVGCGEKFSQKSLLKQHSLKHTGNKPFTCSYADCNQTFNQRISMDQHLLSHKNEESITDPPTNTSLQQESDDIKLVCNQSFPKPSLLKKHKRIHKPTTRKKTYHCDFDKCGKNFPTLNALNQHSVVHSNARPFACTYKNCNKTFKRRGSMKSHLQRHLKKGSDYLMSPSLFGVQVNPKTESWY